MKIKVESCWAGNSNYNFRLSWVDGGKAFRESITCVDGEDWDRSYAIQALNLLENVYGLERKRIRFEHR
jgi:hypothetical protein